ncbi:hypothetical protein D9M68_786120 [compost metagenome]
MSMTWRSSAPALPGLRRPSMRHRTGCLSLCSTAAHRAARRARVRASRITWASPPASRDRNSRAARSCRPRSSAPISRFHARSRPCIATNTRVPSRYPMGSASLPGPQSLRRARSTGALSSMDLSASRAPVSITGRRRSKPGYAARSLWYWSAGAIPRDRPQYSFHRTPSMCICSSAGQASKKRCRATWSSGFGRCRT